MDWADEKYDVSAVCMCRWKHVNTGKVMEYINHFLFPLVDTRNSWLHRSRWFSECCSSTSLCPCSGLSLTSRYLAHLFPILFGLYPKNHLQVLQMQQKKVVWRHLKRDWNKAASPAGLEMDSSGNHHGWRICKSLIWAFFGGGTLWSYKWLFIVL